MYHWIRLSVYYWTGMHWVTRPGEGVSQRPTSIFHAIEHLQVATRCLEVFTDSLHPIPPAGAAWGGHRNERQPTATISDIPPPPLRPLSQELCSDTNYREYHSEMYFLNKNLQIWIKIFINTFSTDFEPFWWTGKVRDNFYFTYIDSEILWWLIGNRNNIIY